MIMIFKLKIVAAFIFSAFLVSCAGNDKTDYTDKSIIPEGKQEAVTKQDTSLPITVNTPVQPTVNTINLRSSTTAPTIVTTQQPAQNTIAEQQAQKTAPGMNPPHGQPGHRCDIAVGAALDSKPAPTPVAVPAQQGANDIKPLQPPVKPDSTKG